MRPETVAVRDLQPGMVVELPGDEALWDVTDKPCGCSSPKSA